MSLICCLFLNVVIHAWLDDSQTWITRTSRWRIIGTPKVFSLVVTQPGQTTICVFLWLMTTNKDLKFNPKSTLSTGVKTFESITMTAPWFVSIPHYDSCKQGASNDILGLSNVGINLIYQLENLYHCKNACITIKTPIMADICCLSHNGRSRICNAHRRYGGRCFPASRKFYR